MKHPIDFSLYSFGPVMDLPTDLPVYDFTQGYDPARTVDSPYGIGRYNEHRPGMYSDALFTEQARDIHIGIDLAGPAETPVYALCDGTVYMAEVRSGAGDYGGTIITEHRLGDGILWMLYGHLSHASVSRTRVGAALRSGNVIGWLGDRSENGGWNPHLHFQLSLQRPDVCDMPGVVNRAELAKALEVYPDPRLVLGRLY